MTVQQTVDALQLKVLCAGDLSREVTGVYCGDLLSWVMGRLSEGEAWVTIMSNVNIIAVATLADPSCIILSENVLPDEDVLTRAQGQGVNLLRSKKTTFEVCSDIKGAI